MSAVDAISIIGLVLILFPFICCLTTDIVNLDRRVKALESANQRQSGIPPKPAQD